MEPTTEFTVKLRGVPFNVKEVSFRISQMKNFKTFCALKHVFHVQLCQQQIREFMTPLRPAAVRIGKNESGNRTGMLLKVF